MEKNLGRFSPFAYALLRIVAGGMFAVHGCQKLFNFPVVKPDWQAPLLISQTSVAGVIELVGGILICLGWQTAMWAFLASGLMAFAYFLRHAPMQLQPLIKHIPNTNGGELAVLYCFLFLFISTHGSGIWSVDSFLSRGGRKSGRS